MIFGAKWIGGMRAALARVLRSWAQRVGRDEMASLPSPASLPERTPSSSPDAAEPSERSVPRPPPAWAARSSNGPPAHWLELVKRGAPHLLANIPGFEHEARQPQSSPANFPATQGVHGEPVAAFPAPVKSALSTPNDIDPSVTPARTQAQWTGKRSATGRSAPSLFSPIQPLTITGRANGFAPPLNKTTATPARTIVVSRLDESPGRGTGMFAKHHRPDTPPPAFKLGAHHLAEPPAFVEVAQRTRPIPTMPEVESLPLRIPEFGDTLQQGAALPAWTAAEANAWPEPPLPHAPKNRAVKRLLLERARLERLDREQRGTSWNAPHF